MLPRLALSLLAVSLLAGCGTTTIVKTVTSPSPTTSSAGVAESSPAEASGDADASEEPAREASLGDPLVLEVSGTTLTMEPLSVIDPLPVGQFDEASSGTRFVGLRLSVRNSGDAPYSDSLSNGAKIIVRGDEQADPTIVSDGPCSTSFGFSLKLASGDKRVGCIAFEVPAGKRLRSFQFTGDSGFADATGEWRLPSRAVRSTPAAAADSSTSDDGGGGGGGGSFDDAGDVGDIGGPTSFTSCDANIEAAVDSTTCAFAQNVFYEYFQSGESSGISAYSPSAGASFDLSCSSDGTEVTCSSTDGGAVRFPQSAVDSYSSGQAADYAASHDVG